MSAPWSMRLASTFIVGANNLTRRKDGTINRRLADFIELKVPANQKPVKGVSTLDVEVDSVTGVWVRVFIPTTEMEVTPLNLGSGKSVPDFDKKLPVVFYYHGGGFAVLSADFVLYDAFCRRLARACHSVVISVNYRRAPEHQCPVPYDDCYNALEWLRLPESASYLPPNVDLSRCFLMGDSAGGNIVHHVGVKASGKDLSPVCIKGHVLIQPFFGGEERTPFEIRLVNTPIISVESADWHWKAYLPSGSDRDHPACNIFGPHSQDLSNVPLPPSLVVAGGLDTLQDWQVRYTQGLKKAGKEVQLLFYEKAIHAFHIFHQLDQYKLASKVLFDICAFIQNL